MSFSVLLLIYALQHIQKNIQICPCGFSMGKVWLEQSMALLRRTTALSLVSLLHLDTITLMLSYFLFVSLSLS